MTTTYVLDANYLRDNDLVTMLDNEPQSKFVVPDVAFVEMFQNNKWHLTMRKSLV